MSKRDILIGLGILGIFGLGAVLFILIIPNFFASEDRFPATTPMAKATTAGTSGQEPIFSPTIIPAPTVPPTTQFSRPSTVVTSGSSTSTAATLPPTLNPTTRPTTVTLTTQPSSSVPKVTQQPYSLPAGFAPSDGAKSCPQPLPIENIRNDYLNYWNALIKAYKETDPSLLEPFIDTSARDGKLWEGERTAILKTKAGGYWLDYQIEHTNQLIIKVNPYFGGAGECQISVFDGTKLTVLAKKIGTDEPFNSANSKPQVQQYKPSHSFEMNFRNGRWVLAGEGAGDL